MRRTKAAIWYGLKQWTFTTCRRGTGRTWRESVVCLLPERYVIISLPERRILVLIKSSSRGRNVEKEKAAVQSDHSSTKRIPHALLFSRISRYSPSSSLGTGREARLASSGADISFPHTWLHATIVISSCETSPSHPCNHWDNRSRAKTTPWQHRTIFRSCGYTDAICPWHPRVQQHLPTFWLPFSSGARCCNLPLRSNDPV